MQRGQGLFEFVCALPVIVQLPESPGLCNGQRLGHIEVLQIGTDRGELFSPRGKGRLFVVIPTGGGQLVIYTEKIIKVLAIWHSTRTKGMRRRRLPELPPPGLQPSISESVSYVEANDHQSQILPNDTQLVQQFG